MLEDLANIKSHAEALAQSIEVSLDALPTFGYSLQDGRPHVEVNEAYDFVQCEKGTEFRRRSTMDLDQILYWALECATFTTALDYELRHRRPKVDSRRLIFSTQEELLASLSDAWGVRIVEEHRRILERHPFDDTHH